jgi:hypothetical protein
MRRFLLIALSTMLSVGCGSSGGGGSRGHFSGRFGTDWETLESAPSKFGCPGFSDYTPEGQTGLYALEFFDAAVFTPVGGWDSLDSPASSLGCWPGPAWVGDTLYIMRDGALHAFDTVGGTWDTLINDGIADTHEAQMTHDDAGHVYAVETDAPYRIVRYTIATNGVDYIETGGFDGADVSEPRIAWDSLTEKLYIAPDFDGPRLFSFDPTVPGVTVELASVPAAGGGPGTGMGDPFCGDRSGHLYAIGDTGCNDSNSVFQYDIQSDTWNPLPDLPENHGCNGAATVSHDGWLYITPGDTPSLYRIRLF